MKSFQLFFSLMFVMILLGGRQVVLAQSDPVMYFCEKYDSDKGEIGISDRFTTGYLTVMVKCDHAMNLKNVHIQFDKYNFRTGKFDYYKKFAYVVDRDMKYIYFSKNSESDMKFDDPGFYRVFLLDDDDNTVASALIEIIE